MREEEKYFDYTMEPGKKRNTIKYYNDGKPLISIITPYYNSKNYIKQTANSILNQTFPYWEWIIINDGSTEEGTKEVLEEIEKMDSRINIYHQENKGRIVARDEAIKKANTELLFIIDSDDQIDKTMLECCYWTLQTNPDVSWVYTDLVNFDGQEFLWNPTFDCERQKKENLIPVCSLIRKKDLLAVGGYGVVDKDVHEDWHLWLRMLEKGYYPAHMNFYGFWYRKKKEGGILDSINKDKKRDAHARKEIEKQADKIEETVYAIQYPTTSGSNYNSYPYIFDWNRKPVHIKNEKIRLLFIFPWFKVGGADKFNYDLISNLDQNKYDITIVTTEPCEYIWRQKFERYAEVFDLTTFLHRKDWAAFLHYLIQSRSINIAMQSNSYYGFYVIPWLKSQFPEVVFLDYLHSENYSWRNGEYPRDSTAIDSFLDCTYTCTNSLKQSMKKNMGRSIDNVETVYIGVDEKEFNPDNVIKIENPELIEKKGKYKGKKVLLFLCRISEEKRPILMIRVLQKICQQREDVVLFVVGDGPELEETKKMVEKLELTEHVIFFGMQKEVKPFYQIADVSIICSLVEGLTITTYESLAMETPVVTADIGGQKELVDNNCGRLVENVQTAKNGYYNRNYTQEEIDRYAKAIIEILDTKDIEQVKRNCRNKIVDKFTIHQMVARFDRDFTDFFEKGSSISRQTIQNINLYKQYLVLYNQLNILNAYSAIGGTSEEARLTNEKMNYSFLKIKEQLWENPLWRFIIRISQKLGIINLLKRTRIPTKIKNQLKKQ